MNRLSYVLILAAAVLWGMTGLFVNKLYAYGIAPIQIVSIRAFGAALILILYYLIVNKDYLKIKIADLKYFIGTGLLSFVFFNWCLFISIKYTSLSVATVLLYSAPAFVALFSAILFKEKMTRAKTLSLILTFLGCLFVSGYLEGTDHKVSIIGIIAGLGSGLGYALYSIFSKYALLKYDPMTIPVYTFIVAGIGLIPVTDFKGLTIMFSMEGFALYAISLIVFSTVLPFILYTKGLAKLESSKASLIATLEPVVASAIGFVVFKEAVTFQKLLGILLVITALMIIREKAAPPANTEETAIDP